MTTEALEIISNAMESLGIEYSFGMYNKNPIVYPYFVGEYTEPPGLTEDGSQEATFMLNGFSRETWLALEEAKQKIEGYFSRVYGNTAITDDGTGIAIFYASALVIPTGDAELKRIQINLQVKEWKVN